MPSTLAPLMRKTQKESRYWALHLSPAPGIFIPSLPREILWPACQLWTPGSFPQMSLGVHQITLP